MVTNFNTIVRDVITETPDTKTLVLDIGTQPVYRAGQYVSVDPHQFPGLASFVGYLEHVKGRREPPRAYSMSSAPTDATVDITIKEEVYIEGSTLYPPLVSGYLVHQVKPGDRMVVQGYAGAYVLADDVESRAQHILHLCAGSGSVPNVSIIKDSLQRHARLRHTLIYSNRTWDDVIFRDQLAQLSAQNPERFRVIHSLTRQATALTELPPDVRIGRISRDLLAATLEAEPTSLVFACGPAITVWTKRECAARGTTPPPQFLEAMLAELAALRVPRSRIKIEAFG